MKNADLQKCILGSVSTNCYLLKNKETGELLIIDPADHAEIISSKIKEMQAEPKAILLTHGHYDHILAAEDLRKELQIPVYACEKETGTLPGSVGKSFRIWKQSLFFESGHTSYGPSGFRSSRFFGTDAPYPRTYGGKLLLLSGGGRTSFQR